MEPSQRKTALLQELQSRLHDRTLLQACPPAPPPYFKRAPLGYTADQQYDPDTWGSYGHPFTAPLGMHQLLLAGYSPEDAAKRRDVTEPALLGPDDDDPQGLPPPPIVMQQTRFFARARSSLVRLRLQVDELLTRTVTTMETDASAQLQQQQQQHNHQPATSFFGGGGAEAKAQVEARRQRIAAFKQQLSEQVALMFEDAASDLMDELYGAFQYTGSRHAYAQRMAAGMAARDAELEASAGRRIAELEGTVVKARATADAAVEAMHEEKRRGNALLMAARLKLDAQAAVFEQEAAGTKLKIEEQAAAMAQGLEVQRQQAVAIAAAEFEVLKVRDGLLQRLEADGAERDALQARLDDAEADVARLRSEVLQLKRNVDDRQAELSSSLNVQKQQEAALAAMQADLQASREAFAALALEKDEEAERLNKQLADLTRILKKGGGGVALEDLGASDSGSDSGDDGDDGLGGNPFSLQGQEYVPGAMPPVWIRLARAALVDPLPSFELLRQLAAICAEKQAADEAAVAAGLAPSTDLHSHLFKAYLRRHITVEKAEAALVVLIQSLRIHCARHDRVSIFTQLLGLRAPALPPAAVSLYMRTCAALRDAVPGLPDVIDAEDGSTLVASAKWRVAVASAAGPVLGPRWSAALVRKLAELRTDQNYLKATFGMVDLDAVLRGTVDSWLAAQAAVQQGLANRVLQRHPEAVLSFWQFKELVQEVTGVASVSEGRTNDLLWEVLAESAARRAREADARKEAGGNADKFVKPRVPGAIDLEAFAEVCYRHGLAGVGAGVLLPLPTSGMVVTNCLQIAADALCSVTRATIQQLRHGGLGGPHVDTLDKDIEAFEAQVHSGDGGIQDGAIMQARWMTLDRLGNEVLQASVPLLEGPALPTLVAPADPAKAALEQVKRRAKVDWTWQDNGKDAAGIVSSTPKERHGAVVARLGGRRGITDDLLQTSEPPARAPRSNRRATDSGSLLNVSRGDSHAGGTPGGTGSSSPRRGTGGSADGPPSPLQRASSEPLDAYCIPEDDEEEVEGSLQQLGGQQSGQRRDFEQLQVELQSAQGRAMAAERRYAELMGQGPSAMGGGRAPGGTAEPVGQQQADMSHQLSQLAGELTNVTQRVQHYMSRQSSIAAPERHEQEEGAVVLATLQRLVSFSQALSTQGEFSFGGGRGVEQSRSIDFSSHPATGRGLLVDGSGSLRSVPSASGVHDGGLHGGPSGRTPEGQSSWGGTRGASQHSVGGRRRGPAGSVLWNVGGPGDAHLSLGGAEDSEEWRRLCDGVLAGVMALGGLPTIAPDGSLVEAGSTAAAIGDANGTTLQPGVPTAATATTTGAATFPPPFRLAVVGGGSSGGTGAQAGGSTSEATAAETADTLRRLYIYNAGVVVRLREDGALLERRRRELVAYHTELEKAARGLVAHRRGLQDARSALVGDVQCMADVANLLVATQRRLAELADSIVLAQSAYDGALPDPASDASGGRDDTDDGAAVATTATIAKLPTTTTLAALDGMAAATSAIASDIVRAIASLTHRVAGDQGVDAVELDATALVHRVPMLGSYGSDYSDISLSFGPLDLFGGTPLPPWHRQGAAGDADGAHATTASASGGSSGGGGAVSPSRLSCVPVTWRSLSGRRLRATSAIARASWDRGTGGPPYTPLATEAATPSWLDAEGEPDAYRDLPEGEARVKFSRSLRYRSQMSPNRLAAYEGGTGGTSASGPMPIERRPFSARSYVEGVMARAGEQFQTLSSLASGGTGAGGVPARKSGISHAGRPLSLPPPPDEAGGTAAPQPGDGTSDGRLGRRAARVRSAAAEAGGLSEEEEVELRHRSPNGLRVNAAGHVALPETYTSLPDIVPNPQRKPNLLLAL